MVYSALYCRGRRCILSRSVSYSNDFSSEGQEVSVEAGERVAEDRELERTILHPFLHPSYLGFQSELFGPAQAWTFGGTSKNPSEEYKRILFYNLFVGMFTVGREDKHYVIRKHTFIVFFF